MLPNKPGWWEFNGKARFVQRKNGKLGWWQSNYSNEIQWSNSIECFVSGEKISALVPSGWSGKFFGKTIDPAKVRNSYLACLKKMGVNLSPEEKHIPIFWKE